MVKFVRLDPAGVTQLRFPRLPGPASDTMTGRVSLAFPATMPQRSGIDSSQAEGREFDSRLPLQPQPIMVEVASFGGLSHPPDRDHLLFEEPASSVGGADARQFPCPVQGCCRVMEC